MNCRDIEELLTPYLLGDLEADRAEAVRAHVAQCDACRAAAQDLEQTLNLLRSALAAAPAAPARLDAARRERVFDAAQARTRWSAPWYHAVAAAAAVLLIMGTGWLMFFGDFARYSVPRGAGEVTVMRVAPAKLDAIEEALPTAEAVKGYRKELDKYYSAYGTYPPPVSAQSTFLAGDASVEAKHEREVESLDKLPTLGSSENAESPPTETAKSPLIMKGLYANRTAGGREGALRMYGGGAVSSPQAGEESLEEARKDTSGVKLGGGNLGSAVAGKPTFKAASGEGLGALDKQVAQNLGLQDQGGFGSGLGSGSGVGAGPGGSSAQPKGKTALRSNGGDAAQKLGDLSKATRDNDGDNYLYDRHGAVGGNAEVAKKRGAVVDAPTADYSVETEQLAPAPATVAPAKAPARDYRWAEPAKPASGPSASSLARPAAPAPKPEPQPTTASSVTFSVPDVAGARQSDAKTDVTKATELAYGLNEDADSRDATVASGKENAAPEEKPVAAVFMPITVNPWMATAEQPLSTFSLDVDTASYTLSRNYLLNGSRPPPAAVRVEEFVNFFDYAYPPPVNATFAVYAECAPSPFRPTLQLLKLGVKGCSPGREQKQLAILTFVVDTSGSMNTPDRLGLVRKSLRMLVEQLNPDDSVAIVAFDSHARLLLDHVPASQKDRIFAVLDGLQTSGYTHLEEGLRLGYDVAARHFRSGGANRVLLLSDGVANLGAAAADDILKSVETYRRQGITCSVFGFGIGTYDDSMLVNLADKGNGAYHFIDSAAEAKRVLVDELAATLHIIASDVKIQVEFNPRRVKQYRQLGYEKRHLEAQDFRNDAVDAGEIGSGQSSTALYELLLEGDTRELLGTVRVRYRDAQTGRIEEMAKAIGNDQCVTRFEKADLRFRLAAAVTEFAEILRGSPYTAGTDFEDVARVLRPIALDLSIDQRVQELLRLIQAAKDLPQAQSE